MQRWGVILGVLWFTVSPVGADSDYLFHHLNAKRIERGVGRLRWDASLVACAREHSKLMAEQGFGHSTDSATTECLGDLEWGVIAEAIGWGWSVEQVWRLLMRSDAHRSMLLRARWDLVAIGTWKLDGAVYVTVWVREQP